MTSADNLLGTPNYTSDASQVPLRAVRPTSEGWRLDLGRAESALSLVLDYAGGLSRGPARRAGLVILDQVVFDKTESVPPFGPTAPPQTLPATFWR